MFDDGWWRGGGWGDEWHCLIKDECGRGFFFYPVIHSTLSSHKYFDSNTSVSHNLNFLTKHFSISLILHGTSPCFYFAACSFFAASSISSKPPLHPSVGPPPCEQLDQRQISLGWHSYNPSRIFPPADRHHVWCDYTTGWTVNRAGTQIVARKLYFRQKNRRKLVSVNFRHFLNVSWLLLFFFVFWFLRNSKIENFSLKR